VLVLQQQRLPAHAEAVAASRWSVSHGIIPKRHIMLKRHERIVPQRTEVVNHSHSSALLCALAMRYN
jgi:hypothetical protein